MQKWIIIALMCLIGLAYATTPEEDEIIVVCFTNETRIQSTTAYIINNTLQTANTERGEEISTWIYTQKNFNVMSVSWQAVIPQGASLEIRVKAMLQDGTEGEWQAVPYTDADIKFEDIAIAYQYYIGLQNNESGESPAVTLITFSTSLINDIFFKTNGTFIPEENYDSRSVTKPTIVSRSEWGARSPTSGYSNHTPQKITIHHTWRPTAAAYAGASTIRSIQNYHMDTNGWSDIGYHFLIGTYPSSGDTKIYQGRPETVIGAHTGGANTNNVGVNVIGDYTTEILHKNSYNTLIHLLAWLCVKYNISTNNIYGHCDFNSTQCPGGNIYNKLAQIRQDVKNYISGGTEEKGKLVGVIYDAVQGTNAKISGATVKLNTGASMTTGTDGLYSFELPSGTYQISVQKSGYQTAQSSDTVTANNTTWESMGLKK